MSRLYGEQHRELQDRFQSRKMADRIEQVALKTEIGEEEKAFIESRDFFFLSTVDHQGRPTVSHKGGDPGFVKVLDAGTLMFPSYDGNGMYLSMGNIAANAQVGFLFIDFERPFRLRAQGTAELSQAPELLAHFKEADLVVRVAITRAVDELPALHPSPPAREVVALRAARERRDAGVRMEAPRHGAGCAAAARAGAGGARGRGHRARGVDRTRAGRRRDGVVQL